MQNQTIKQIHDMLVDQVSKLSAALSNTTDPGKAKELLLEMQEITHRVDVSQNLIFAATSKELKSQLSGIQTANTALQKSIDQIGAVASILSDVTQLLTLVDQALDLAKTLVAV
jgi:signal transduction histidine kinase